MAYSINTESCEMCGACKSACPVSAIFMEDGTYHVDEETCVDCGSCESACGFYALAPKA